MTADIPRGDAAERADFWIRQRKHLDDVLERPAVTLIHVVRDALHRGADPKGAGNFSVPMTIDDGDAEPRGESLLVHAVACSAVQALHDRRRQHDWLKPFRSDLDALDYAMPAAFTTHRALMASDPLDRIDVLYDVGFGTLSPLTSAEVFWVLVRGGESHVHGDVGFLALFSLLWALKRDMDTRFIAGASLGNWRPTVAVTTRAVMPILTLTSIIRRRARLYRQCRDLCQELRKNEHASNENERWRFASALERLSAILHDLARISLDPRAVHSHADEMTALANPLGPGTSTEQTAVRVRTGLRSLFVELGRQNAVILRKAEEATLWIQRDIITTLGQSGKRRDQLERRCKLRPDWPKQMQAATLANDVCCAALTQLQRAVTRSKQIQNEPELRHDSLISALEEFADINDNVQRILNEAVEDNTEWCRRAVMREVAFASANNDTEFDAAELLSGVVVAERIENIARAQIEDAVRHSLRAVRADGSWASSQPIYLEKRVVSVRPSTPDLLLLLATAVRVTPRLDVADEQLLRFVDWLEARRMKKSPKWWTHEKAPQLWGWPSESREPFIDLWATATATRALLEIRTMIEDRLWEICEDRFTVVPARTSLSELDPVDLGARHDQRLQTRLFRTVAKTKHELPGAEYAYVLHGPPGSSKTAIATAIGGEMKSERGEARLIRITPADFTRRGEEGIDLEARFIFNLLQHVREVTVVFDEIDDLLRTRKIGADLSFIRLVIPGMLNRLQDLRDAAPKQQIWFLLATNYVDQIEPALTRPGRLDGPIPVPYPDVWSRESILERIDENRIIPAEVKRYVVAETAEWPWTTYQKLCRKLAEDQPTMDRARVLVSRMSSEFQAADHYYRNPERWQTASPLIREFVHFTFGTSKASGECRSKVTDMLRFLGERNVDTTDLHLIETFDAEWREQGRR